MAFPLASRLKQATTDIFLRLPPPAQRFCADLVARSWEEITYRRLVDKGFRPGGIIDVGAFRGDWTRMTQQLFGNTPAVMVEAQPGLEAGLNPVITDHPSVSLVMSPLSGAAGEEITFYEMGTGSSFLPEASNAARVERRLVTRTLDDVAAERLSDARDLFLKIDVQGAELHVLAGGAATLAKCALVQLEVALLQYNQGAPLMPDVVAWMAARDFLPIEVSGFSRPRDELVQIDLLFAPKGSSLRPDHFTF